MNDNEFRGQGLTSAWPIEQLTIEVDWQNDLFLFAIELVSTLRSASVRRSPNANEPPLKPKASKDENG